jgi:hypothetical protein
MTKKIFPGNYINHLSGFQGQPVVGFPGRLFTHLIGYAKVDATPRQEIDVIIPSPDKRPDDKPRPDIVGMRIPENAFLYHLGLRVLDARKDPGKGDARSGLTFGATTDRVKLANAAATALGALTATTASTPGIQTGSGLTTTAPQAVVTHPAAIGTQITTSGGLLLKVFNTNAAGTAAGTSGLSTSEPGGIYLICEAAFWQPDATPGPEAFGGLPSTVETL